MRKWSPFKLQHPHVQPPPEPMPSEIDHILTFWFQVLNCVTFIPLLYQCWWVLYLRNFNCFAMGATKLKPYSQCMQSCPKASMALICTVADKIYIQYKHAHCPNMQTRYIFDRYNMHIAQCAQGMTFIQCWLSFG